MLLWKLLKRKWKGIFNGKINKNINKLKKHTLRRIYLFPDKNSDSKLFYFF